MVVMILYYPGYVSADNSVAGCRMKKARINGSIDLSHLVMRQALLLKVSMQEPIESDFWERPLES